MLLFFKNLKIRSKLYAIVAVAILAIVVIQALALNDLWQDLKQNKYSELGNITAVAHSIVTRERQRVLDGAITTEQAQNNAKALIRDLRYGNNEYFFILDSQYRVLMHPIKPALDNTVQKDFADSNGVKLFQLLVDKSKQNGEAMVDYVWPRQGESGTLPKSSFAKYDSDWNWILATGVYTDDLANKFQEEFWSAAGSTLLVILSTLFVAYQGARSIIEPVETLSSQMQVVSQTRDLTIRVNLGGKDEFSDMSGAFDQMLENFEQILSELNVASEQVSSTSTELSATTAQTLTGMEQQKDETRLVASAMTEMSATVSEVANSINEAALASHGASAATQEGKVIVENSISSVADLSKKLQQAEQLTHDLEQQSAAINTILEVISNIAEQTNLLALNATIEAARAGEQGRGFAVVADEVRNLSSRTHQSTNEISEVIANLQAGSQAAAQAMKESKLAAEKVEAQSASVQDALTTISGAVEKIDMMTTQIASASEQQSNVAEVINKNIININEISEQSATGSEQINSSSTELAELSGHLREIAQRFTVRSELTQSQTSRA